MSAARTGLAFLAVALAMALAPAPARAQDGASLNATSCQAFARTRPDAGDWPVAPRRAGFLPAATLAPTETRLAYIAHSTFLIESAGGVRIATDYTGRHGAGPVPDAVTMNHAHSSHYTDAPDLAIPHVLRGWNPAGGYAEHDVQVGDVHIRNVPTNIRTWGGGTEEFGNSVFIFEMVGLCIVHLGHLHHELSERELAQIGLVDVVLVPVDGSYTLDHDGLIRVLETMHARLIVPMHYFSGFSLARFLERMEAKFAVRRFDTPSLTVSRAMLPVKPEIWVLPPGY